MALTVRTVTRWLDEAYPPGLAESWDEVGLGVGDPDAPVTHVHLAVDVTDAVVAEAAALGADLLVTHHPLLLKGLHAVRADEPKGRLVLALVAAGIAQYAAHTNADAACPGVSDALADVLGLTQVVPLAPQDDAGPDQGLGRLGVLPVRLSAADLARRLAAALPRTAGGVRLGGDPDAMVSRVAVLGGAGDSFLDLVRERQADAYVTSDLRHHPAQEALAWPGGPVLVDVSHWAAESLWLPDAAAALRRRASEAGSVLTTTVSTLVTDPWVARY